jgi:plastocyanin
LLYLKHGSQIDTKTVRPADHSADPHRGGPRTVLVLIRPGLLAAALSALALAALAGPGARERRSAPAVRSAIRSGAVVVAIDDFRYEPARLTVRPGTAVTFTNRDPTAHTVSSGFPGLDTGTLAWGERRTLRFATPGTYSFICRFHAFMQMQVVVRR